MTEPALDVVCLCAEWCVNCRAYRAGFEGQGGTWNGRARLSWLDVEDESEVVGELDIENFPSMLLLKGDVPLFLGPITPQPQVLQQLVQSALDGRLSPLRDGEAQALAQRIRAHLDDAS
jgi:thioredoxin 1